MPHIQANGHTSHTQHEAPVVTEAICRYLAGEPACPAAEKAGMPPSTLRHTLRRHDLMRSKTEAWRQKWIGRGRASQVARQRLIETRYTKYEANDRAEELAEKFDVSERTIRRDLRAIGYELTKSESAIRREWGSFRAWHEAQRRAALLVRKRGWQKKEAREELGVTFRTLQRLLAAWDDRKGKEYSLDRRSTYATS